MKSLNGIADIKKLAKQLKGLIDLADDLENINSLDQAAQESKMRFDIAKKEEMAAIEELSIAKSNLAHAEAKAIQITEKAKLDAEELKNEASLKAFKEIESAKEKADVIINEANKSFKAIQNQISEMSLKVDSLNELIDEKNMKLASVTEALEKIKGGI